MVQEITTKIRSRAVLAWLIIVGWTLFPLLGAAYYLLGILRLLGVI